MGLNNMAITYEPIATTTVASSGVSGTITFSSIASTYTDLRVILVGQCANNTFPVLRVNSDTGTNYSHSFLRGNGTAASAGITTSTNNIYLGQSSWNQRPMLCSLDLFSYSGSTKKIVLASESGDYNGGGMVTRTVGLWDSTSAINSISLIVTGDTWNSGTIATIYGIKAA